MNAFLSMNMICLQINQITFLLMVVNCGIFLKFFNYIFLYKLLLIKGWLAGAWWFLFFQNALLTKKKKILNTKNIIKLKSHLEKIVIILFINLNST